MADISARPQLALLIDADNVSHDLIGTIMKQAHLLGNPILRRAYGDWSKLALKKWRVAAAAQGISLVQATPMASGKNASDMVMVIDALDILATNAQQGFAIVSTDSDFAPLVTRIKESGTKVFGMGRSNACEGYKAMCTKYIALNEEPETIQTPDALIDAAMKVAGSNGAISLSTLGKTVKDIIGPSYKHTDFEGKNISGVVAASKKFRRDTNDQTKVCRI